MNSIEYLEKEYNENKGFLGSSNFEQNEIYGRLYPIT
jgi:hypothetical protein